MSGTQNVAMAVTVLGLIAPTNVWASDHYSFPSTSGTQLAAIAPPAFLPTASIESAQPSLLAPMPVAHPKASYRREHYDPPPGVGAGTYGGGDAVGYRFVTEANSHSAYANYIADYARNFAPGYAVKSWTDRVFGIVEIGYGAVDGWTSATYGMTRLEGPSQRLESAPDLSVMPAFRSHPELEQPPTFRKNP